MARTPTRSQPPSPSLAGLPQISVVTAAALVLIGGLVWHHWQPQQQLRSHTKSFLKAVEEQRWDQVEALMAATYQDQWGLDRSGAIEYGEQTFQHFATLSFNPLSMEISVKDEQQGQVSTRFEVRGLGSPIATLTKNQINSLAAPFIFHWHRPTWKPFEWQLTRIENPSLELDLSQFD